MTPEDREADENSERRKERDETFHKKRGRNRIKLAGFGVDFKMKLLPTDSETGRKMQRGTPSDGKGEGHTD